MITLLAILAVVAQVTVVVCAGAWLVQKLTSSRPFDAITQLIGADALRIAALAAVVATVGSLYFSEVRNFQPCNLCWFQRIGMYPLAVLLVVASITNDRRIGRYIFPLAFAGAAVSIYHYQLERFPQQESISCSKEIPCTTIWFEAFGYITLPMLALSAFALISMLTWIGGRYGQGITKQA